MEMRICVEGCEHFMICTRSEFAKFKVEVLRGWNEELSELLAQKYKHSFYDPIDVNQDFIRIEILNTLSSATTDTSALKLNIDKILNEFDLPYNKGMKIFIYITENTFHITPEESKLILESFKRVDDEKFQKNEYYERLKVNFYSWIEMLLFSVSHQKNIVFI